MIDVKSMIIGRKMAGGGSDEDIQQQIDELAALVGVAEEETEVDE